MPDERRFKMRRMAAEAAQLDAIQPVGWLIVCNSQASKVLRHSANLGLLFPDRAESLIGASLSELLGSETAHGLRNALGRFMGPARPALLQDRRLPGCDGAYDLATSRTDDETLIEIEKAPSPGDHDDQDRVRAMIDRLTQATEVEKLLVRAARLVFSVLQYDRVSILRFEDDGSARVLAQQKNYDLEQDNPAADVTAPARDSLGAARLRFIADLDAPPSPILAGAEDETPLDLAPLDLSWSYLRAVEAQERDALRRDGYVASLSLTLSVDDDVWGLILCQNRTPRHLSMATRALAEIFGDFLSLYLQSLLQKQALLARSGRTAPDK